MSKIVAILYDKSSDDYVIKYRNIFTGECCHRIKKRLGVRERFFINYIFAIREADIDGIIWYRKGEV